MSRPQFIKDGPDNRPQLLEDGPESTEFEMESVLTDDYQTGKSDPIPIKCVRTSTFRIKEL